MLLAIATFGLLVIGPQPIAYIRTFTTARVLNQTHHVHFSRPAGWRIDFRPRHRSCERGEGAQRVCIRNLNGCRLSGTQGIVSAGTFHCVRDASHLN